MVVRRRVLVVLVFLVLGAFAFPGQGQAQPRLGPPAGYGRPKVHEGKKETRAFTGEWTPANTVILANRVDARFGRDFSTLLKHLRLEWIMLDDATVPEAARDKNVLLVGRLEAEHTGELIRELVTAREIETLRAAGTPILLEKKSLREEISKQNVSLSAIYSPKSVKGEWENIVKSLRINSRKEK